MFNLEDYKNENGNISLLKVLGERKVKDIEGYISTEFGDHTFKLTALVLDNDKKMWFEGEHDFPYITDTDDELLEKIYLAENSEDED